MRTLHRRAALALLVAGLAAGGALAQEKLAAHPIKSLFKYLDTYYTKIPAADRDRFTLAYYLRQGGAPPPPGTKVFVVQGTQRTQLAMTPSGKVELPSLALLNSKATVMVDKPSSNVKLGFSMGLEPTVHPATQLAASELAAAIDQTNRGIKRAAGVLGMAVPKMGSVRGVGAGSGEVVLADGRRAPLPVLGGAPAFIPASWPNARTVVFATTPTRLEIGGLPKPAKGKK